MKKTFSTRKKLEDISQKLYAFSRGGKKNKFDAAEEKLWIVRKILAQYGKVDESTRIEMPNIKTLDELLTKYRGIVRDFRVSLKRPCAQEEEWAEKIEKRILEKLLEFFNKYNTSGDEVIIFDFE